MDKRFVERMKIGDSRVKAPPDNEFRDIVSTLCYAVRYPRHGQIFAGQLEEEQGHLKTRSLSLRDHGKEIANLGVKAGE